MLPFTFKGARGSTFTIRLLCIADVAKVQQLLAESFVQREPLTDKRLSVEEFLVLGRSIVSDAVEDGLSLVVTEEANGGGVNYISALISEDAGAEDEGGLPPGAHPHIPRIYALLEELGRPFYDSLGEQLQRGQVFHAAMGFTAAGYEGRGIGKVLRRCAVDLARSRGFAHVVVEATNPATQSIWVKHCGGTVHNTIRPGEWVLSGSSPPLRPWAEWDRDRLVSFIAVSLT